MSIDSIGHPIARFLVRRYVELLTILAVLFVLQAGLVPFDFVGGRPDAGSTALFGAKVTPLTFPDIVSNIFLYVPLGALLHWTLSLTLRSRTLVLPVTIVIAAALSGAIEWIQAYSPIRVSSIIDFVSNVLGASLGATVSWLCRSVGRRSLGAALFELHERPQAVLLKLYCLVLVVFAAIPFSFSFDSTRLKRTVKSANFVPFRAGKLDEAFTDKVLARGDYAAHAHLKWQRMKCWSRWAAECASFVVLSWLCLWVMRYDYGFGRWAAKMLVLWLGGLFAVGLSALQFPIISRACDVTDILFRLLGLCLGIVTWSVYLGDSGRVGPGLRAGAWQRLMKLGCAAAAGYIFYAGLIPLTFDLGNDGLAQSLGSKAFLPFYGYFIGRFDLMMDDAMEKLACYAVFAALLATCWTGITGARPKSRPLAIAAAGVGISVIIELFQMFIPVRVTSLTDPILAGTGCLAGAIAQQYAVKLYQLALSVRFVDPDAPGRPVAAARGLAPGDALIAALADPNPDAPSEPSPRRTPLRRR
ncbi:MAG: VanZ family protein [Phycisphaerales bacterium]|nr:MAG: VanZ family protein [Phycisphaerales bacterium]